MALVQADVDKLAAAEAKIEEIRDVILGSLSLRATGGSDIVNALIKVLPELKAVKEAIQADVDAV
jgi:hypothetical protein